MQVLVGGGRAEARNGVRWLRGLWSRKKTLKDTRAQGQQQRRLEEVGREVGGAPGGGQASAARGGSVEK